jgi:hypothetical protein
MKTFFQYLEAGKKYNYIGTCQQSIDDGGDFENSEFASRIGAVDATQMGNKLDDSRVVKKDEFISMVEVPKSILDKMSKNELEFGYNDNEDFYFAYDADEDIHYFFG